MAHSGMDEQDFKIEEQLGRHWPEFYKKAVTMRTSVMTSENTRLRDGLINYSEMQTRMAVVHTREDLILAVSYLHTIITLIQGLRWILLLGVCLLAYIALR